MRLNVCEINVFEQCASQMHVRFNILILLATNIFFDLLYRPEILDQGQIRARWRANCQLFSRNSFSFRKLTRAIIAACDRALSYINTHFVFKEKLQDMLLSKQCVTQQFAFLFVIVGSLHLLIFTAN